MRRTTKIKKGLLVSLCRDLPDDPRYQTSLWESDLHYLRDPYTLKISNVWIDKDDLCIVIDQDSSGLVILTPRGLLGWIGKERMELVR